MEIKKLITSLLADTASLCIFSDLSESPLISALAELLAALDPDAASLARGPGSAAKTAPEALELCRRWAGFTESFARHGGTTSFYAALAALTLGADNLFTRTAEKHPEDLPPVLKAATASDLDRLGRIAGLDITKLGFHIAGLLREKGLEDAAKHIEAEARAFWESESAGTAGAELFPKDSPWSKALPGFCAYIKNHGAGELGQHLFFSWQGGHAAAGSRAGIEYPCTGAMRPAPHPDPVRLADLAGYEEQRSVVIANTLRFLEGKPANNLLLYGDRGTGKSATIKAVCREYAGKGIRLLELRKKDLFELPAILDTLAERSLSFVIFIDDLSFEVIDDSFIVLKALLEGSIEIRPPNVVIYATSNRRHLVKEKLSDRPSLAQAAADLNGEVRAFDTMQEQFSLSDRFGLTVVFTSPSQDEYLAIAEHIARGRGLLAETADTDKLRQFRENALRWEKWFNGRSPRTAVQFADWLAGGEGFPWE
jgi:predicted AAA+ superfamily ATPase